MSVKALRAQRKTDGLCIDCGQEKRDEWRFLRCFTCRVKQTEQYAARQRDMRMWLAVAAGIGLALSPVPLDRSRKNSPNHNI